MMKGSLSQTLINYLVKILLLLLVVLFTSNIAVFSVSGIGSAFMLMAIYTATIFFPGFLSLNYVFFAGLWVDYLNHQPLGISSLFFAVFYSSLNKQARLFYGKSMFMVCSSFFLTAVLYNFSLWAAELVANQQMIGPWEICKSSIYSGLIYILLYLLSYRFLRKTWRR